AWVDTGDPLPPDFDAVIMIEQVHRVSDDVVEIMQPVAPWQHVRPLGEDIVATELVLTEGRRLGAFDLGAIAASGNTTVSVRRKPAVAILPTGTELVQPGAELRPGDVVEFNSIMLAAQVQDWGGTATVLPAERDDRDRLLRRLRRLHGGRGRGPRHARRPRRRRPTGTPRGAGRLWWEAGPRDPGLSRLRRSDRRALSRPGAPSAPWRRAGRAPAHSGFDDPEGALAHGRGRIPAREAGPG